MTIDVATDAGRCQQPLVVVTHEEPDVVQLWGAGEHELKGACSEHRLMIAAERIEERRVDLVEVDVRRCGTGRAAAHATGRSMDGLDEGIDTFGRQQTRAGVGGGPPCPAFAPTSMTPMPSCVSRTVTTL